MTTALSKVLGMMMPDLSLIDAYVLHTRKYRDTSLIVELLTLSEGRISAVIRGARGSKSKVAGNIRPFGRMLVSLVGRGELKTVRAMDFPFADCQPKGDALLVGLYVNELLVRLLGKFDPAPALFAAYGNLVSQLASEAAIRSTLRSFELTLLQELGYGVTFEIDAGTGAPVEPDSLYRYVPDEGFHRVEGVMEDAPAPYLFRGDHLLAIVEGRMDSPEVDGAAKRVTRASLAVLLGGRRLKSRELFQRVGELT